MNLLKRLYRYIYWQYYKGHKTSSIKICGKKFALGRTSREQHTGNMIEEPDRFYFIVTTAVYYKGVEYEVVIDLELPDIPKYKKLKEMDC